MPRRALRAFLRFFLRYWLMSDEAAGASEPSGPWSTCSVSRNRSSAGCQGRLDKLQQAAVSFKVPPAALWSFSSVMSTQVCKRITAPAGWATRRARFHGNTPQNGEQFLGDGRRGGRNLRNRGSPNAAALAGRGLPVCARHSEQQTRVNPPLKIAPTRSLFLPLTATTSLY